jgi:hypothetical protein
MALSIGDGTLGFRGYPVTVISEGADAALARAVAAAPGTTDVTLLLAMLRNAVDLAEPGEPSGWQFRSHIGGTEVWIERFGGVRDLTAGTHEGGQWSVYLPAER